jgi:hypothetical protein
MLKYCFALILVGCCAFESWSQSTIYKHDTSILAKIWSKDSLKQVKYSNWKPFLTGKVDWIKGFNPQNAFVGSTYGGNPAITVKATGFFYTAKINNRWFVIDPEGHPFNVTAVNSIRPGTSSNNDKALQQQFGSNAAWASATIKQLQQLGFNTAGSWSDVESIKLNNRTTEHPFAYTSQLSLLSGYIREAVKKNPARKNTSALAFIMDEDFITYCNKKAESLTTSKNDPNLLFHRCIYLNSKQKKIQEKEAMLNWIKVSNYKLINKESNKKSYCDINEVKPLIVNFLNQVNQNIKNDVSSSISLDGWFDSLPQKKIKSGWDKQQEALGLPTSVYDNPQNFTKRPLILLKIDKYDKFETDQEIQYVLYIILGKQDTTNSKIDQLVIRISFYMNKRGFILLSYFIINKILKIN